MSGSGTQLTLVVSVTFQTSFAGAKNDYLIANDNEGLNSTWQQMGTWTVPAPQCTYSISPTSRSFTSAGGSDTVTVTAGAGCSWTAVSNAAWITINGGASGSGNGTVSYSMAPNSGAVRSGTMTIAGQTFTVTQSALCTYSISPASQSFTSATGSGTVSVTAGAGCSWTAVSNAGWITITGGASGSGGGTVSYSVAANSGATRSGTMTIAGQTFTVSQAAAPLVLPSPLRGFTYFPRGHAWYNMLYEWYSQDCTTSTIPVSCVQGQTVKQVVLNDLQRLASLPNRFNFIHLYVWDQDLVQATLTSSDDTPLVGSGFPGPGFVGFDIGGPESSPANQWAALAEFISAAKNNGFWVFVDLATRRPKKRIDFGYTTSAGSGTEYGTWVNKFIDYLAGYQNVLIWGVGYGVGQGVQSDFWHNALPSITSDISAHSYTSPAGRSLLAVTTPFVMNYDDVLPILSGYRWTWEATQREAFDWQQTANATRTFAPDLFSFQFWNSNAGDLQANLECLAGGTNTVCPTPGSCGANCAPIPFSKMVVTEFGTGSSLEPAPIGNGLAFYGDAQTPTTTADGQREWITQTLCMMNRLGITKYAYHGLYDAASFWERYYSPTALQLAWGGYWGLSSEDTTHGDKPAWSAMADFNAANCPGPNTPPTPVIALYADATYYTINDTGKINYTAANVTSLSLSEPVREGSPASNSCDPKNNYAPLSVTLRVGSCAFTNIAATNTGTITLTGNNTDVDGRVGAGLSTRVATSVTVGLAPNIKAIVNATTNQSCDLTLNPNCVITASQLDVLEIYGEGFKPDGGNSVLLRANDGSQVYLDEADQYYFWDQSRIQLNAQIGCFVTPPGSWTLSVKNPNSGNWSTGVPISILASGSCP